MADEPIDENPLSEAPGEDDPIESQAVESQPIESQPIESQAVESPVESQAESAGDSVIEAQVVAANVRKPVPRWIYATAFGVIAVGGALFAFDSWVRSAESDAFGDAVQRDSVAGWDTYLSWAEEQGFWTHSRTPIERHVSEARERKDLQRANAASAASDWPALCTMLNEFETAAPAYLIVQRTLRERAQGISDTLMNRLGGNGVPPGLRHPVESAYAELIQNTPCGLPARVRFQVAAEPTLAHRDVILGAASSAIDVSLQPVVQELSTANDLFAFELSEGNSDAVALEYSVGAEFVSGDVVRISDGSTFVIPAVLVEARVHGPSVEMASLKIRYALPPAFGVELFAESRNGKSVEELITLAVQRLVGHVPARLRQTAGLTNFLQDGGVAAYSSCGGMEVIDRSTSLRSDTHEYGTDRLAFSCEEPEEPYYEGCCDNEDMNAVGRPEIGYRLTVNERSLVSLSADGDWSPIVAIMGECGPASREISCGQLGSARAVLDPGVYTAYVAAGDEEEAGPYDLMASIQPVAAIARACTAVSRTLQPGVAVRGNTAHAEDNFAGECGGAGVGEDTYRLQIPARSRVRCHVEGFELPVLHARSECEEFESEVECAFSGDLRVVADEGVLFVSVDGVGRNSKGSYELLCEVEPEPASSEALCANAEPFELTGQNTALAIDLLSAPLASPSLCGGNGGPEAVYRFELSEESFVQAINTTPGVLLGLSNNCTPGACASVARRLPAGTHHLVARGRTPTQFSSQTVNIRTTPLSSVCEEALLLRAGVTGGAVGGAADTPMFGAECSSSSSLREAVFRVRALHPMQIRLHAEGFGLSIQEGCGGRSLTCAPTNVGRVEARLEPGEYTVVVQGRPGAAFQLETEIERL